MAPQHGKNPEGERPQLLAKLLYETALLESGFSLADNKAFNKRVYSLVKDALKIKADFESFDVPEESEAVRVAVTHYVCVACMGKVLDAQ